MTTGWFLVAVATVVVAVVPDRVLLWADSRGWVSWRHRKPSSSSLGNAMLSVQALVEPTTAHVVEERCRQEADIDVSSDDEPLD